MPYLDEDLSRIQNDKDSSLSFRERKHSDWKENYTLYRDKVIVNRLTQTQTINIPLMRYGLQTVMKDIDEPPLILYKNKDNNQQKELYCNAYWDKIADINKLPIRDRVDKKQNMFFGRTFKSLNMINGIFRFGVEDPQDMLVERYTDPADIDSTRFLAHTGIFKTLTWILNNPKFDPQAKSDLKNYYSKDNTNLESETNYKQFVERQERMSDMGLNDALNPLVGETYIELNDVLRLEYNKTTGEDEFIFYIVASTDNGLFKLYKSPLDKMIGKTSDDYWKSHVPFTSWGMDIDRGDFWSDGAADTLRPLCKVLNSWISQLVQNRTLKNFNMHYFNSTTIPGGEPFVPQTFTPVDWGWYPVPGNPADFIKDVAVPDLSESLDEIQFLIGIGEKAIAASGSQTGQVEQRQVTLGEIQIAVANAKERTKSSQLYYQEDWKNFGEKYIKMLEARGDDVQSFEISRRGRQSNKIYLKEVSKDMFDSTKGWEVEVTVKEDRTNEQTDDVQKLNLAQAKMPSNIPLQRIYKKKLLDFANLSSEDQKEVMDFEEQSMNNPVIPAPVPGETSTPVSNLQSVPGVIAQ